VKVHSPAVLHTSATEQVVEGIWMQLVGAPAFSEFN
jgi:hypothetical protein